MIALSRFSTIATVASLGIAIGLTGCGMGTTRTEVKGAVTLDGSPLESGRITFEPQGSGKMAVGPITQGAYHIGGDQAPTPDTYLVRITAERPTGKKPTGASRSLEDQGVEELQYEQYLPAKYNSRSELTIEVTEASDGNFDFALTSN